MTDQSKIFRPTTSRATSVSTCSPESADGITPSSWQDGGVPYGPEVAPANHSQMPESERARPTTGTCGPLFDLLSPSASLQSSLENRLRVRLDVNGSPEYVLTWKHWDMPAGPPICALRASARSMRGHASGGLPTPSGTSNGGGNHVAGRLDEWGGSSNPFRGTNLGKVHCPAFELWMMGYPVEWWQQMRLVTPSFRKSRQNL